MKLLTTAIALTVLSLIAATGRGSVGTRGILAGAPCEGERADVDELAREIDRITDRRIRALVISTGRYESRGWRHDICSGEVLGDKGKAFGCFQAHHPDRSGGYEGQVQRAARLLRWTLARCGTYEGAIAHYATGHSCEWSGASERAEYARKVEARLEW